MTNEVALIAGPTASGKSHYAVALAQQLAARGQEAVIINADSAQVYQDLLILSARPDETEMAGIPHKLFGEWDGALACSAADWAKAARAEISAAHSAGILPILVGGTGLYIRTLLDGIAPIPPIDDTIREDIRAMRVEDAYQALEREDPERADFLNPADATRVKRALEVVRSTGHPLLYWQQHRTGGIGDHVALFPLILLPEREWLYSRCNMRLAAMMENGAITEVEKLLGRNLSPSLPVMRAIGVQEIAQFLRQELDFEESLAAAQQATRNYAKRQYTWFRRQPPADWKRTEDNNYSNVLEFETLLLRLGLT